MKKLIPAVLIFLAVCTSRKKKVLFISPMSAAVSTSYSVGGTVSGLSSGSTVILSNNGTDSKSISANGTFSFDIRQNDRTSYSVSVNTQPSGGSCKVQNGTGKISGADVKTVSVVCTSVSGSITLGGTVSNLTGTLVLLNNGTDTVSLNSNGTYTFPSSILSGSSYSVTVQSQPSNQNCTIQNAQGTAGTSNVSNIDIVCSGNANGPLVSGTIINNLTLTGGVVTLGGSFCNPNTVCAAGNAGMVDSATNSSVRFDGPVGIVTDGFYLYIADKNNHRIRKMNISTGGTTTLAGTVQGTQDGPASSAKLDSPEFITTDGAYIYAAEKNSTSIRRISLLDGTVTTLITDGVNLQDPKGMAVYGNNLYILEKSSQKILQLNLSTLALTTVVSTGITDPKQMTVVGNTLYWVDKSLDEVVTTVIGVWSVSTFAGSSSGHVNATGTSAKFNSPEGITTDGTSLYVSDTGNNAIRKIDISTGAVSSVAGPVPAGSTSGYTNDSTSSSARFDSPRGITSDGANLFVIDKNNETVRKVN